MEKRQRRESATESCPVCHEAVEIYAIGSCDHPVCYRCALRMRALCEQLYCPICRTDLSQVFMVHQLVKEAEVPRHGYIPNRKLKIFYEDNSIKQKAEKLLEYNCLKCKGPPLRSFKDLQNHMRREHTLFYCDLCIEHLNIFPFERKYYTRPDLATHRRLGDKDDSSYKGHPLCRFCDDRYMDNDELYRHLRKDHYYCHFCEKDGLNEFYSDYPELRQHFMHQHYLCEEDDCVHAQFTNAFRTEIDFKAHTASEHNRGLTKAQARQTRVVEVDIQLAPRKAQQRGILTIEDNADTAPRHRGRGGGASRGGRPSSYKNRFRDEDVEKAIKISLETMKEDSKKPSRRSPPVEDMEQESPKIVHDESNFPSLGSLLSAGRPLTPTEDIQKDRSIANKLAKARNMSVQHGALGMADFPTLGQSSNKAVPDPPKPTVAKKPNMDTQVETRKNTNSVSNQFRSSPVPLTKIEDFPVLASAKSVPRPSNSAKVGSWGVQPPAQPVAKKPLPSKEVKQVVNVTMGSKPTKSIQYNINPSKRVLVDDKEFPSLGNNPKLNLEWGKLSTENKQNKPPPPKTVDWFDVDENEFNINNFKGDKKVSHSDTESKSKKKKKKQKHSEASGDGDKNSSAGENSSLDNIASSLLPTKNKPIPDARPTEKETAKKKSAVTEVSKSSTRDSDEEFEGYPEAPSTGKLAHSDIAETHSTFNKFQVLDTEDFPQLVNNSVPKPVIKQSREKAIRLLDEEEYPSLGGNKKPKAPPGFSKPSVATSPPGFGDAPVPKKPPPGFGSAVKAEPNPHEILNLQGIQESLTLKTIAPISVNIGNFLYSQLEDFQARNHKLISDIRNRAQDNFDKFKTWSGDFRSGQMSASDYYDECENLLGKDNFTLIFPELLVLLPDIDKQQELLSVYKRVQSVKPRDKVLNISGKGRKAAWDTPSFSACPTCRQVLLSQDYNYHTSIHGGAELDFPSLHSDTSTRAAPVGHGLKEWVRAK